MADKVTFKLVGARKVVQNLNREAQKLRGQKGEQALIRSAAMIRRDMDKTSPKIPVKTSNLRNSWTAPLIKGISGMVGMILGFTASYAAKVHFAIGNKFKRPGSGALFFSTALKRNTQEVLKIFRDSLKI